MLGLICCYCIQAPDMRFLVTLIAVNECKDQMLLADMSFWSADMLMLRVSSVGAAIKQLIYLRLLFAAAVMICC
ncbi:unnamed protein product [Amaranthus hypochondriacus]